jgi:hypothetical protein
MLITTYEDLRISEYGREKQLIKFRGSQPLNEP